MNAFPQGLDKASPIERRARARGEAARQDRATTKRSGAPRARGDMNPLGDKDGQGDPSRASLYDEVTARIVAELEAGRFPWAQPWDAAAFAPGLPRNADTRRSYSGINILILWSEAARRGFAGQGWLTFRQAQAAGGQVRKGEKGTTIFYAARFTPKDGGAAEAAGADQTGGGVGDGERAVPFLKRFTVFNVAQVDGLPDRCTALDGSLPPREIIPHAENLLAVSGADIRIGGNDAYYSPLDDFIALPPQQAFFAQIDYYRTALHELGHWTGHKTRLDRDQSGAFASGAYGREELCAELASAFLCAALGIRPTVRHADYLGAWLAIMRADTRAIFKAASLASKAADYLLGFAPDAAQRAAGALRSVSGAVAEMAPAHGGEATVPAAWNGRAAR
ncbi:ArdC family protein [Sphingopyxis sp.]|uniref:ArdC family protein n=1 Tax=Sphingopyxis sp. TaxID=1908224 RepID=UPI003FA70F97